LTKREPIAHIKYARKLPSQSGYPIHGAVSLEIPEEMPEDEEREARPKKKKGGKRSKSRSKQRRKLEDEEAVEGLEEPEISPEFALLKEQIERQLTTSFVGRMKWEDVSKKLEEGVCGFR
jgi:predicted TIM-barrel fold metal-dependent hydrolase